MVLKKDKAKVLGESFDDERIKGFLTGETYGDNPKDFCLLERAYRGMIPENFARFTHFFTEAGFDLNAKNSDGLTMLQIISEHKHGAEYTAALVAAGAKTY